MIRSLYSGVAGMKTQQTKMDVIGNNIANVSTFGYKFGRAAFRDIYYQTTAAASAATATSGGTNPLQIGYGSSVASVDINHGQASFSTTGYTLDCAIAGEGYFQVMDNDGNIFYTKAGIFDIDAEGNLVDSNGYFVLGVSGSPTGQPAGSQRIRVNLPFENPSVATAVDNINGIQYTISSSNETDQANVNLTFASSSELPIGQKALATVTNSSIVVTLNANETFASLDELNNVVNEAITAANNGVSHPGGEFVIEMDDPSQFTAGITGAQLINASFGVDAGTIELEGDLASYFNISTVGDAFAGEGEATLSLSLDDENNLTITLGDYTGTVLASQLDSAGTVLLKNGTSTTDAFVISYPSLRTINGNDLTNLTATATMTPSADSPNLGLGNGVFTLAGGTEGGEQTVADLTGISINEDGVLIGSHATFGLVEIGRIDLATFANAPGLSQVGETYFEVSLNSGDPILAVPGEDATGSLVSGTLESSNVDLTNEFADMIVTQRGFQASSRMITVSDTMLEELINLKR